MNGTDIYKIYSGNANEAEKNCVKKSLKLFKKSISTSKKARQSKDSNGLMLLFIYGVYDACRWTKYREHRAYG